MRNKNTPEIRFPGYIGNWEERKIGEFLKESRISGTNGLEAKKLTVKLWGKGVIPKDEIYQGSEATKYYIRKAGQFIYGKLDFLNQAFGIIPDKLDGYESTLDSPAFDIAGKLNSFFFLEYVSRKQFHLYHGTLANGSRKAKRIHSETFLEMPLIVPTLEEQSKVGNFFKKLDETIALHQQELTILKQIKQGFLQKMFPKEGESVPEVRFRGFAGEWEERKLGEVLSSMKSGLSRMLSNEDIGLPVVRANNINEGKLDLKNDIKYWYLNDPQGAKTSNYLIHKNDILINFINSEAKMGTATIVDTEPLRDTIYTTNILNLRTNNLADAYFIFSLTMTEKYINYIKTITKPAVNQASFTTVDLKEFAFIAPTMKEQAKIGNFFKQLDDTVALHQRELEALKETKKAFLQKMFA